MRVHEGVRFAVVEGTFLAESLDLVEKLVLGDGGTVANAALPPPDAEYVIVPLQAEAADPSLVSQLLNGHLEEWQGIPLITVQWIKLTAQVATQFKALWDEYEIGKETITRSDLDFRGAPYDASLIVDVDAEDEAQGDKVDALNSNTKSEEDAKNPSTPDLHLSIPKDDAEDVTPKPFERGCYPFPASEKSADPSSPGTRSPPSELGSTLSAPPTPTKSKNKNAQRKAARKRAKNRKKNLGELEETEGEGEDESTTTDRSKSQEQENFTVWERVRNLKNKNGAASAVTDRIRPQATLQLQAVPEPRHCNWCGTTHDQRESFEYWGRAAEDIFPEHTIMDTLFGQNATNTRSGWEATPRREKDNPKLAWEQIRDLYDPNSPNFFTDQLFNAFLRCLNDHLQEQGVKALVLGTAFWDALLEESIHKHPVRGPLSQFGLCRCGYTDISFGKYDRIVFPIRFGDIWTVALLDVRQQVVTWYDAFGARSLDTLKAKRALRILDMLVITDPDVGSFDWDLRPIGETYVQEVVNYSGIHAALSCELLARQGRENDHLLQWFLVEFRRSWYGPAVPKTVPQSWLRRAIRWVIVVCAKGTYAKDAWEADERCAGANGASCQPADTEVKGLAITGVDIQAQP